MDPLLKKIVAEVNRGGSAPTLRVVAGNTLFVGTPGRDGAFSEGAVRALAEEHYNARRPKKKDTERVFQEAMVHGEEAGRPLTRAALEPTEGDDVLTLLTCQVWPASGGDGVEVPVVRIPLSSDGWWPGAGQLVRGPKQGGGWLMGFGVMVPLDGE